MGTLLKFTAKITSFVAQATVYATNLVLWYRNTILPRFNWNTRQNLLTYSEDFSNADWNSKTGITVNTDALTAPDGTTTADNIEITAGGARYVGQGSIALISGQQYTASCYLKNGSNGWGAIAVSDGSSDSALGTFDLSNGVTGGTSLSVGSVNASISIENSGNGWYRCFLTFTSTSTGNWDIRIYAGAEGAADVSGQIGDNTNVWGAQLNEGDTADDYVKTEANAYSFKGDETQLNDFSASNNGGQIYSGGALSFDGVNDEVTGNKNYFSGSSAFSISILTATDSVTASKAILSERDAPNDGVVVGTTATSEWFFGVNASSVTSNTAAVISDYTRLDCVWDGSTISLYINGEFDNSTSFSGTISTSVFARLAGISFTSAKYAGDITDCKIYNRALTASEVLQNYNNPQQPITDGLEVWYDFNELNGGTLFDRSGNGYNATINGATWVSGVKEGFQPALSGFNNYQTFDGSDDYVQGSADVFDGLTSFVVNSKFSTSKVTGTQVLIDTRIAGSDGVSIGITSDQLYVSINGVAVTSVTEISTSSIYDVSFVWDGTEVTFVINGVSESPQALTGTISGDANFRISSRAYVLNSFFQGIIDYVEVEGVGRWSNLGGWVDEIGSNDGSVNGSPSSARIAGAEFNSDTDVFSNTIQNAYIANALNFSGGYSGLYVDAGANVDTSGAFSFAGWVKYNTSSFIFSNRGASGDGLWLYTDAGVPDVKFRNFNPTSTTIASDTINFSGEWIFIVVTTNADGTSANIYKADKTNQPALSGTANRSIGDTVSGGANMTLLNNSAITSTTDGYLIYPLMYTEDLSTANTDLAPIEQIWDATKSLIPS